MINVFALLLGLAYSTYTDLKTGYVDDWLSHSMIVLGIILVPFIYPNDILLSYATGAAVFALGYALYIYGNIGGGDVKIFTAIALLVPKYDATTSQIANYFGITPVTPPYPFILSVFLVSGIIFMVFISIAYTYKLLMLRKKIEEFRKKAATGIIYAAVLLPFFYYWSYFSWPMTFLYLPVAATCFIMPFRDDFVRFIFAQKKLVAKLDDDDILALEMIPKSLQAKLGIKRKTHTKKELVAIKASAKRLRIRSIFVCENLPKFVPYIMASTLLNLATGDLFLYLVKNTTNFVYF